MAASSRPGPPVPGSPRRGRATCSRGRAGRCWRAAAMLLMRRFPQWAGILRARRLSAPASSPTIWRPTTWRKTDVTETTLITRIAARGDGVTADGRHVMGAGPGDHVRDDGTIVPRPNRAEQP